MPLRMLLQILVISYCFFSPFKVLAQARVMAFTDVGIKNVTNGVFIKSSAIGTYKFGRNLIESGLLMNLRSNNQHFLPGIRILASREVLGKKKPVEFQGFLLQGMSSDILSETNYGALFKIKRKYYDFSLGTNFRTYAFTRRAIDSYEIQNNAIRFMEPWNLMYALSLYLNQMNSNWNIGLSVTNFDYFLIYQETNPEINLKILCQLNARISLLAEGWYETSGLLNRYANFFGVFARTGIKWNIK